MGCMSGFSIRMTCLWLGVGQPLQVSLRSVRMMLLTDDDQFTETLSFLINATPLAVDGRRIDLAAGYRLRRGRLGSVGLNLVYLGFASADLEYATKRVMRSGFRFYKGDNHCNAVTESD